MSQSRIQKQNCGVEFFIESNPLLYAVAVVVVVDVVVIVVVVVAPFVFTDHLNRLISFEFFYSKQLLPGYNQRTSTSCVGLNLKLFFTTHG